MRLSNGRCFAGASLLMLSALLASCGLLGDGASGVFVAPGKYSFFNCDQLADERQSLSAREEELTKLKARAAQTPAGEFVGAVAYQTELLQARAWLKQISELSAQKNCTTQSKWQSERALW